MEAGNIVRDMFELLLTRDLVIADVSIHNANVFYELGIRHALRDKRTFLIRFKGEPMPFENLTERYFEYDRDNPGASIDRLHEALARTRHIARQGQPRLSVAARPARPGPGTVRRRPVRFRRGGGAGRHGEAAWRPQPAGPGGSGIHLGRAGPTWAQFA